MKAMVGLPLAGAEALFLDKLHLVVRHPLACVAFIILVLAWVWRAYFLRTRKHLERLDRLPDADRLTALQMLVLGFPKTLTRNRLKVFQWQYMLVAFVATLASIIILAGLAVHTWSLPEHEIERRLGRVEAAIRQRLAEMEAVCQKLQDELDKEEQRLTRIAGGVQGVRVVADWAESLGRSNPDPEVADLAKTLGELIAKFDAEFGDEELSEVDHLRLRLVRATCANAERRFQESLKLVTREDLERERQATKAQIDLEVRANQVRGDALFGLRRWEETLNCYERIVDLCHHHSAARWTIPLCLRRLGRLDEALERSRALVDHYRHLVEEEGRYDLANKWAMSLNNRGNVSRGLGKLRMAIADYDKAIDIQTPLVERENRDELAIDLARILINRGVAIRGLGKPSEAVADYNKAIDIYTRLVERENRGEFANELATSLTNRGVAFECLGKLAEAIADYDKAIDIYTRLVKRENRGEFVSDLATSLTNRGNAYDTLGKPSEAVHDFDKAVEIFTRLVEVDKRDELANDLATTLSNRGNAYRNLGKLSDAVHDFDKAVEIFTRLVEVDKRDELADDLAMCRNNRGSAYYDLGTLSDAIADYDEAINIYRPLVLIEKRDEFANDLATSLTNRGLAYATTGDFKLALDDMRQAIALREHLVHDVGMAHLGPQLAETRETLRFVLDLQSEQSRQAAGREED